MMTNIQCHKSYNIKSNSWEKRQSMNLRTLDADVLRTDDSRYHLIYDEIIEIFTFLQYVYGVSASSFFPSSS